MNRVAVTMRPVTESISNEGFLVTADRFPNMTRLALALLREKLRDDRGQTFAEYVLILAMVVVVGMVGVSAFGVGLAAKMTTTFNAVIAVL